MDFSTSFCTVYSGKGGGAEGDGRLQHQEVVGMVLTGQAGLRWSNSSILWSKVSRKEKKDLVVAKVTWGTGAAGAVYNLGGCREFSH